MVAMKPQEVTDKLELNQLKEKIWFVVPSCATTGEGLLEGLVSIPPFTYSVATDTKKANRHGFRTMSSPRQHKRSRTAREERRKPNLRHDTITIIPFPAHLPFDCLYIKSIQAILFSAVIPFLHRGARGGRKA
jgi:hypothetical protein